MKNRSNKDYWFVHVSFNKNVLLDCCLMKYLKYLSETTGESTAHLFRRLLKDYYINKGDLYDRD